MSTADTFKQQLKEKLSGQLDPDYVERRLAASTITEDGGRITVKDSSGVVFSAESSAQLAGALAGHMLSTAPSSHHRGPNSAAYYDEIRRRAQEQLEARRRPDEARQKALARLGLRADDYRL